MTVWITATACGAPSPGSSHPAGPTNPILPAPRSVVSAGGSYELGDRAGITLSDAVDSELAELADLWATPLRVATGMSLPVGSGAGIHLSVEGQGDPESYRLVVEASGITVSGADHAGVFYGLQTLSQLMAPGLADGISDRQSATIRIPRMQVQDAPRFPYRGMQLDVGRHFFGPEFVKRYIDMLARYKINRFHWHLTEDQGWRIEILRYPKLTEIGAYRAETQVGRGGGAFQGDGKRYGGFYTQDEVRDIVEYARRRYVTIVPEIEMPGHSLAALAAYPELGCTDGPFEVGTRWGVYEDIYCPKEETFEFLENVLTEVMELFPGEYIHIGGDEAPKARWESSPVAQAVIAREGLADEHELQSWFIARIERFLNRSGRQIIGWDEILEGGLAPNATVMSWRGVAGGIEAARQGHDVVMTPTSHLYLDYYQSQDTEAEPLAIGGFLPLDKVYAYEPVPPELDAVAAGHVLGAQGNVWTEYIPTSDHVEYMVFPRMFAIAELTWSAVAARDFGDFASRLPWHFKRLDALGVTYRVPDVVGLGSSRRLSLGSEISVPLTAPGGVIRYTVDGSDPNGGSSVYTGPVRLKLDRGPVTLSARTDLGAGRLGTIQRATFERAIAKAGALVDTARLEPGLRVETMAGRFPSLERMERAQPERRDLTDRVGIPEWARSETFGLRLRGYLTVPETGVYTFALTSDDGSELRIANQTVIDNGGLHGPVRKLAEIALASGTHPIEVVYFQAGGGAALSLEWSTDAGVTFEPVTDKVVRRVR